MSDFILALDKIFNWVEDRNFREGANLVMQQVKGEEELKEVLQAFMDNNQEEIIDGVGDSCVVLMGQCVIAGANLGYVFEEPDYTTFEAVTLSSILSAICYHGDMAKCIAKSKPLDELQDKFKLFFWSLCYIAKAINVPIEQCINTAYAEIKDREGMWVNGSWVKQSDLKD